MPTKSEICHMLTELRDILDGCGIPTMRGNRASNFTSKLVIINAYADDAKEIIEEGEWPATVQFIGQGISIIKPVY